MLKEKSFLIISKVDDKMDHFDVFIHVNLRYLSDSILETAELGNNFCRRVWVTHKFICKRACGLEHSCSLPVRPAEVEVFPGILL